MCRETRGRTIRRGDDDGESGGADLRRLGRGGATIGDAELDGHMERIGDGLAGLALEEIGELSEDSLVIEPNHGVYGSHGRHHTLRVRVRAGDAPRSTIR